VTSDEIGKEKAERLRAERWNRWARRSVRRGRRSPSPDWHKSSRRPLFGTNTSGRWGPSHIRVNSRCLL